MMKKIKFLIFITFFIFSLFFATSQTVKMGIAYDNYDEYCFGLFGNISSNLFDNTTLTADLSYYGTNNYKASILTSYSCLNFLTLNTGFIFSLEEPIPYPSILLGTLFTTKNNSKISLDFSLGFNSKNLTKLDVFNVKAGFFVSEENASLDFSFEYKNITHLDYQKITIDSIFIGFQEGCPFNIGILFTCQGILARQEPKPLQILMDFGIKTDIIEENSIKSFGIKTRFIPYKKNDFPFIFFLSKTVTF